MRELLNTFVEWFLNLHALAKVTWFMGIFVVLLFTIPLIFGESLVKGDPDERTRRAATTLRQLDQATGLTPAELRQQEREERRFSGDDDDDDNDNDPDDRDDEEDEDDGGERRGSNRGTDL